MSLRMGSMPDFSARNHPFQPPAGPFLSLSPVYPVDYRLSNPSPFSFWFSKAGSLGSLISATLRHSPKSWFLLVTQTGKRNHWVYKLQPKRIDVLIRPETLPDLTLLVMAPTGYPSISKFSKTSSAQFSRGFPFVSLYSKVPFFLGDLSLVWPNSMVDFL